MSELVRAPGFAHLPLIVEDFVKDAGASFSGELGGGDTGRTSLPEHSVQHTAVTGPQRVGGGGSGGGTWPVAVLLQPVPSGPRASSASEPGAMHVVLDRHLVTGQNASSTIPAVHSLFFLCGSR